MNKDKLSNSPISEPEKKNNGYGCLAVFGLAFFLMGIAFAYLAFIRPVLLSRAAQDWPSTPCKILTAEIETHRGDDSTTYSAEFTFQFEVDGKTWVGDQFSFVNSSGGRQAAKHTLKQYPVGSEHICYYDPENPEFAVLDRENKNLSYFNLFVPLIFSLVGGAIMLAGILGWFKADNSISGSADATKLGSRSSVSSTLGDAIELTGGEQTKEDILDQEWSVPRKLESSTPRLAAFIGISIFALIWNGILGAFLFNGFGFKFGFFSIFVILFMVPFFLVGLATIAASGYYFLALFNPKVEVALSSGAVPLGGEVDIAWEINGKVERIKNLSIKIHGTQRVTFVRGTDTVTETSIFELVEIVNVSDPTSIAFGSAVATIPADTMHTFDATNNKVIWSIEVHGEIPYSPDIFESYPFRVTPPPSVVPPPSKKAIQ